MKTEVLLVEKDSPVLEDEEGPENERELEALAIAGKIRSMVGAEKVLDKETGEYRPLRYGDIVILLRSACRISRLPVCFVHRWQDALRKSWRRSALPVRRE